MKRQPPFAVFVLVPVDGGYAATTRANGRMGLPGGQVEPGETAFDAVYREAEEEGWDIAGVDPHTIQEKPVDGRMVWWFKADAAKMRKNYKEKGRITPFVATAEQIYTSGYGNDTLPLAMTVSEQLKTIHGILNVALAPTLKIEGRGNNACERPMSTVERVQWLANEYREAKRELDHLAEEAAGEDL